ncbi:MAG: TrkA C-terminal domain-containing protein [Thermoplasmata archaeon]
MGDVEFAELPGAGLKYVLTLASGNRVVVLIYNDGCRELYSLSETSTEPVPLLSLTDTEAKQLGDILAGHESKPEHVLSLENVLNRLKVDWITVDKNDSLCGKTIGQANFRAVYGVTVIAVVKKNISIPDPDNTTLLEEGDHLVMMGTEERMEHAFAMLGRMEKHSNKEEKDTKDSQVTVEKKPKRKKQK